MLKPTLAERRRRSSPGSQREGSGHGRAPVREPPHGTASKSLTGLMLPELVSARVAAMDGLPRRSRPMAPHPSHQQF